MVTRLTNREGRVVLGPNLVVRSKQLLRRLLGDVSGGAAVEFAFAVPLMVAIAVGGFDFGRGFQQKHRIAGAAQAAAQYAVQRNREFEKLPTSDIEQRAKDDAGNNSLNAVARYYCVCPGQTVELACTASCAPLSRPPSEYVEVTIQDTVNLLLSYPGVSDTIPITAVATMRIN